MKNLFFKLFVILIGVLIAAAVALTFTLDSIVKSNIERISSELLDTEVTVDRVNISILGRSGSIQGFHIANPEGFEEGTALQIKSVNLEIDPVSLLFNPVIVRLVEIEELELSYQLTARGSNLGRLAGNLPDPDEADDDARQIIIERLLMENTELEIRVPLEDVEPLHVSLDRFEQTDIGHDVENDLNNTMRILFDILLSEVESQARAKLIEEGGTRILDEIEGFLRDLF